MLISEAFINYREIEVISRGLSPKTLESYVYAEKLVIEYFTDTDIKNITTIDVAKFYQYLCNYQRPDTARGNIICLRSVLKRCVRKGWLNLDVEDIKIPKREKRIITYLTESEVDRFIFVVGKQCRGYSNLNRLRNVAIVSLLYDSGIRISELCSLNRNSIKERQFIVIGKSKNPRICFITEKTERKIKDYLDLREDNERALFIANQTGKRITSDNVRKVFQNACDRSDFINIHPHTIRHSFATRLLDKEVDIRYIAELMGHESLDTTKMYTHFSNPKLKKIYENALS